MAASKNAFPAIPLGIFLVLPAVALAQGEGPADRGELLYSTYCGACHSQQMHWREKRLASDWTSLKAQVRRWQANTGRSWEKGDTTAIACYLNAHFYRFPPDGSVCD